MIKLKQVDFGPTNSFWRDFPALNNYITRCQSFLQAGNADNDLLLYYPIYDSWSQPGRTLLQHYGGGHDTAMRQTESRALLDAGYSFDLISDRQLAEVKFAGDAVQAGGLPYKAIVLPQSKLTPLKTLDKLISLARSGATIIVRGNLPSDVPGLGNLESQRRAFQSSIGQIKFSETEASNVQVAQVGKGRFILADNIGRALSFAGVKRETLVDKGLQFVRRKHEQGRHYFIVNQSKESFAGWIAIQSDAKSVAIFDPMREEKGMAAFRSTDRGNEVYLQLAPGESCILKTFDRKIDAALYSYFKVQGEPQNINGKWSVSFIEGGPELPATREIASLGSWTEFGGKEVKRFSGTARYAISFDKPSGNAPAWVLDLGRVAEGARVRLNGRELGSLIKAPYRLNLPSTWLKERNALEIDVSNLMANRIVDLDRRNVSWKKFYNINFPSRTPENKGADGLFSAARWAPFASGLIGPVTLTPAGISKINHE